MTGTTTRRRPTPAADYPPYEILHQQKERARRMQFARPDWTLTLEDAELCHDRLGCPVPFSGDLRPIAGTRGPHS